MASSTTSIANGGSMPYIPRRISAGVTIAVMLVILAPVAIWYWREHRQLALNRTLIHAIGLYDVTTLEVLLNDGADPNARQEHDDHRPILQRLVQLIHRQPPSLGKTAVMVAIRQSMIGGYNPPITMRIVKALLAKGADPNARDKDGMTPVSTLLLDSRDSPQVPILELLLAAGARMEATGPDGETALMDAAYAGDEDCVRLLLEQGANPNPKWCTLGSPFNQASSRGDKTMLRLLKAYGAR